MISRSLPLVVLLFVQFSLASLRGDESAMSQRVSASFLLALGRLPDATELAEWSSNDGGASVDDLVRRHREQLQQDPSSRREVAVKAFTDAFGVGANSEETSSGRGDPTYVEQVHAHIAHLRQHPGEYRAVIDRAYRRVVRRGVYDEEIEYWSRFGVLPYAMLVGCVDNWGRRNQPGLMVTVGTPTASLNSVYLSTVRVSRAVAEEARALVGLPVATTDYHHYGSSRTVIAPGAEDIVSDGRIHFVAVGAPAAVQP